MLIRFYRLGEPLWLDETKTVFAASQNAGEIVKAMRTVVELTPPLFPFLLHGWIRLLGGSDRALHGLTALIGSATVAAVCWTGLRTMGRRAGLAAGAIMALHPLHLFYSQELRAYALLVLLSTLSFLFLSNALKEDRRADWSAFAAVTLANLYTHNYAVFLLAGLAAWACLEARQERARPSARHLLLAGAVIALGYSPWLLLGFQSPSDYHMTFAGFLRPPGLRDLGICFSSLAGVFTPHGMIQWPPLARPVLPAAYLALTAYFIRRSWYEGRAHWLRLLVVPLLTLAIPGLISLWLPMFVADRYVAVVLPFICLLAGSAVVGLNGERARALVLTSWMAVWSCADWSYFTHQKSFDRDIARFVRSHDGSGSEILVRPDYWKRSIARYYPPAANAKARLETRPGLSAARVIVVFYRQGGHAPGPLYEDR